jgi:hypothetical protein
MANNTDRGTEARQIEEMPAATTPPTSSGNYYVTQPMCHARGVWVNGFRPLDSLQT